MVFFFSVASHASENAVVTWQPSGNSAIAGYKIYSGLLSRDYSSVVKVGKNVTSTTIKGLTLGTRYYFCVTCYNSAGGESIFSPEIVYVPGQAALTSATRTGGQFSFSITGLSGQKYVVQTSTDLQSWVPCSTNTSPFQYSMNTANADKQRFFRATLMN